MAHTYYHARTNARMFGGAPEEYLHLHFWMDATKEAFCDFRHRALRHHSQGIYEAERIFGSSFVNSVGKVVPVRICLETHILEDLGRVPSISDWLSCIKPEPWMARATPVRMKHGTRGEQS